MAYGVPKETVIAIMTFYKDMKAMLRSPDDGTEFFDIVARVL